MKSWAQEIAAVTAAAEQMQAAEEIAEARVDVVFATDQAPTGTEEFRAWMAARVATDAAWGHWSQVMDNKPADAS